MISTGDGLHGDQRHMSADGRKAITMRLNAPGLIVLLAAYLFLAPLASPGPDDGRSELKRLWTDPAFRGRGVASSLVRAALTHAASTGVGVVRLSVWQWRTSAVALYERFGFAVTEPWDARDQLVCMERAV